MRKIYLKIVPIQNDKLPVYRQIADAIERDIRSGTLAVGTKLPTVRELAGELSVSNGTVIRTYDHLERLGLISMSQGKGTFVEDVLHESTNRKTKAVKLIENTVAELENMAFSHKEIRIYFDLILRDRAQQIPNVRVGIVDCNPEALHMIFDQLRGLEHVELYKFLLESVQSSPFSYDDNLDILTTTATHYPDVLNKTSTEKLLVPISLSPANETIANLAQIPADSSVAIVCKSNRFRNIMMKIYNDFSVAKQFETALFEDAGFDIAEFIQNRDTVILPVGFSAFCSSKQAAAIENYTNDGGKIIFFHYRVDQGSLLHMAKEVEKYYRNYREPAAENFGG